MKLSTELYARSSLEELTYPFQDQTIMVTGCRRIWLRGRK